MLNMMSAERNKMYLPANARMSPGGGRAFMSVLPAASRMLFGCQSMKSTVDPIGFFRSFEIAAHQLLSPSKEQVAIALVTTG